MKKVLLTLCLSALAWPMFSQITLEHTFEDYAIISNLYANPEGNIFARTPEDFSECFISEDRDNHVIYWWDENYTQHSLTIAAGYSYRLIACSNIFTTDNRMCFVCTTTGNDNLYYARVYDEFGTVIYDFPEGADSKPAVTWMFGGYKFIIISKTEAGTYPVYVYSLPGRGVSAAAGGSNVQEAQAPRRASKRFQDNNVVVDDAQHTYSVSGQVIK